MPLTLIDAQDLQFSYTRGSQVLSGISFQIQRGDFFGIIGPNGSGKSTLLKLMLGLLRPTGGRVLLFGEDPRGNSRRADIGYVSQTATHFDRSFPATVLEVVLMGRSVRRGYFKKFTDRDRELALNALKEVGMGQFADRKIGSLSTGQQQRVVIARAIAGEPKLLILDEPTVGVDVNAEEKLFELLHHLNRDHGMTLVIVSHDLDIIGHHVNKLMCVHCTVATHGAPHDFLEGESLHAAATHGIKIIPHHTHHHQPKKRRSGGSHE